MIDGAHVILYSTDVDADRAFFRDVLELPNVDVGQGWLIFGLPPTEVATHPSETGGKHELYFMCARIDAFVAAATAKGVPCGDVQDLGWGLLSAITLPGGGEIGVYEPRHERPPQP